MPPSTAPSPGRAGRRSPRARERTANVGFNPGHRAVLDALLHSIPGVRAGKMFGYPAYYVRGKLFACVYGGGVATKVPEELATRLLGKPHIVAFRPMGRPAMREWVQINRVASEDYRLDVDVFRRAARFVGAHAKKKSGDRAR